jgi:hypothetical protein
MEPWEGGDVKTTWERGAGGGKQKQMHAEATRNLK